MGLAWIATRQQKEYVCGPASALVWWRSTTKLFLNTAWSTVYSIGTPLTI